MRPGGCGLKDTAWRMQPGGCSLEGSAWKVQPGGFNADQTRGASQLDHPEISGIEELDRSIQPGVLVLSAGPECWPPIAGPECLPEDYLWGGLVTEWRTWNGREHLEQKGALGTEGSTWNGREHLERKGALETEWRTCNETED